MHNRQRLYNAIIILGLIVVGISSFYSIKLLKEYVRDNKNIASIPGPMGYSGSPGQQGLQGQRGIQGLQGEPGLKGDKGEVGLTGPQGLQGAQGMQGPQGVQGEKGEKGDTGETGPQGEPGQNGREIEVRHNDELDRTEWRYVGDEQWQVLVRDCEISDTCL